MPARARGRRAAPAIGSTAAAQQRHVVAERLAEAARLEEIALHVDDEQRRAAEVDGQRVGSA